MVTDSGRARRQADLFRPAPPTFIEPCLPTLVHEVPKRGEWLHELKWDGYRLHVRIAGGKIALLTRRGHDWTHRFPLIADAARSLPVQSAYIDGEAVVEVRGKSDFAALEEALLRGAAHKAVLYAFDLLFLDGVDLRRKPLIERKEALGALLSALPPHAGLRHSEHLITSQSDRLLKSACEMGLEGLVSKRVDLSYEPGRSERWLKVKCVERGDFVVAGYLPAKNAATAVGSLVLGAYEGDRLAYVGRVGTGFTDRMARTLWELLNPLRRDDTPLWGTLPPGSRTNEAIWVEPNLVADVQFGGWGADGLIRHASFKGVREDKDPTEATMPSRSGESLVRSVPAAAQRMAKPLKAGNAKPSVAGGTDARIGTVAQTTRPISTKRPHQERAPGATRERRGTGVPKENILQLLPDAVVPPREVLEAYWMAVADKALKFLGRRPLKLVLHRRGTTYYHKGRLPQVPSSVHQLRIEKREGGEGVRLWVDDLDGLLGLVEMGAVELHPWGATVDDIEHPDTLVFDLDPGPQIGWDFLVETALKLRHVLEAEGLKPWPKLTGGKGIHLMVPVRRDLDWDAAQAFCKAVAERITATDPRRYTVSAKQDRTGRLFLDYLRVGRGTTAIGTYSPRARPGFPVAMPVTWREVENGVAPDAFTIEMLITQRSRRGGGRRN